MFSGVRGPSEHRAAVLEALIEQLQELQSAGVPLRNCTRHTLGLFNGEHGARHFRRTLTENRDDSIAPRTLLNEATRYLREAALYGKPAATAAPVTAALHIATIAD
jgi:tRNA-dihydrouridine synthase A